MNPTFQSFYMENGSLGWPAPSLKQLFSSAVNYKNKFQKGIISSWEGYNDNHVSLTITFHSIRISKIVQAQFVYLKLYNSTAYKCHIWDCLWIHHWVMLQFVLPNLAVDKNDDLESQNHDGTLQFPYRHGNWKEFIRHMDEGLRRNYYESYDEYPKFGLVWLGKRVIPNV